MKDFEIKDYSALAEVLLEDVRRNKKSTAILFYDEAIEVIKALASKPNITLTSINIDPPDWGNYTKEYMIDIGDGYELFVEPAWRDKSEYNEAGYVNVDAECVYIDSRADEKIFDKLYYRELYTIKNTSDNDVYTYWPNSLKCEKVSNTDADDLKSKYVNWRMSWFF